MFIDNKMSTIENVLELQRMKFRHEDNLRFTTVDEMFKRLESDGFGGVDVVVTNEAKDYRNTLLRIATLQSLLRRN